MHPLLPAILADESPFDVGPDTLTPAAELTADPVSRETARAGLPRAHVWTQFPDTATGRAMRASSTLTVAVTTSPIYQNGYLPPDHRYSETPWVFPGRVPITEAEAEGLGEKMGREILHTMFASGQHVGAGAVDLDEEGIERGADGLIYPFGIGNVSLRVGAEYLDVNPIYTHPEDAIQTGIYSEPGQVKDAGLQPTTDGESTPIGRFTVYTANSRAVARAMWRACWQYVKANRLAYVPPGGGGPYELCIPDGFAFDVEEFLDRRIFHQDQWDGSRYVRRADLREMFLARREDGTATTRASTEPIMYGPGGVEWTLDDWWENDVVARGVWADTKVLPEGRNFYEVGSPIENLGKELGILAHAIVEFYLGETIIAEYIEAFGRTPRWTTYQAGFCKQGSDAPASAFFDGQTRYPAVTMNYLRGWIDDPAAYGTVDAATIEERVAEIERVHAFYDLTRPSIAEVPVPRDGGKPAASVGDDDAIKAILQAHGEAGICEFVVWNDVTTAGNNRNVELFWPVWQRHLAWAAFQQEEPGTGNLYALLRGALDEEAYASVTILPEEDDAPEPRGDVLIDDGIASALFLKMLTTNIALLTGTAGRGDTIRVETFCEQPGDDHQRVARIIALDMDGIGRIRTSDTDAAVLNAVIVCIVADGSSAHASMEVASVVRKALERKGIEEREHRLEVLSIRRGYARPDENKAIAYATLGVRVLVQRTQNDTITAMGSGAEEGGA